MDIGLSAFLIPNSSKCNKKLRTSHKHRKHSFSYQFAKQQHTKTTTVIMRDWIILFRAMTIVELTTVVITSYLRKHL